MCNWVLSVYHRRDTRWWLITLDMVGMYRTKRLKPKSSIFLPQTITIKSCLHWKNLDVLLSSTFSFVCYESAEQTHLEFRQVSSITSFSNLKSQKTLASLALPWLLQFSFIWLIKYFAADIFLKFKSTKTLKLRAPNTQLLFFIPYITGYHRLEWQYKIKPFQLIT